MNRLGAGIAGIPAGSTHRRVGASRATVRSGRVGRARVIAVTGPHFTDAMRRNRFARRHCLHPEHRATSPAEAARAVVALHATDPEAVRREIKDGLERRLLTLMRGRRS